jgi:hypothetical protein
MGKSLPKIDPVKDPPGLDRRKRRFREMNPGTGSTFLFTENQK